MLNDSEWTDAAQRHEFVHCLAQVWLGYNQSLRPTEVGLTLNIDMAATAFLEVQKLVDFICRALGIRPPQLASARPTQGLIKKASKAITGIKVSATLHGKRPAAGMLYSLLLQLGCMLIRTGNLPTGVMLQ